MKAMNWNEYVNYCNEMEAKRKAARKLMRDNHPVFCTVMDIVSDIMIFISFAILAYMTFQYVAEKIERVKQIVNKVTANTKAKFDGDRDERVVEEDPDEYLEAHADEAFMA